jgi:hypothetical protein
MEKKIEIYESEIADYLFDKLIRMGYVPEEAEVDDLASIFFDYLIEIGVMDEEDVEEDED